MKQFVFFLMMMFVITTTCSSCKGSAGKAGKKLGAEVVEYGGKMFKEEENTTLKNYKNSRRFQDAKEQIEDVINTTPQPVTVTCGLCAGQRYVFCVDAYGNIIYDFYGNPQIMPCPSCGGAGQKITYQ